MILAEDARDCLITSIYLDYSFKSMVKLCEDRYREKELFNLIEESLWDLFLRERNIFS